MNPALIIVLAIILSAFFSGMEIAFISSNKLRIEIDKKGGSYGSKLVSAFSKKPGQFIVTMLIGNNIALVIYGLFISDPLETLFNGIINADFPLLLIQTIISTFIILLVAEFLPKAFFRKSPNFFLKSLSLPTAFFYGLFYPFTKLIVLLSNGLLRLFFGVKADEDHSNTVFSKVDLDELVGDVNEEVNDTDLEEHDIKIFQKALDLSNVKLRACMVPRTEIAALSINSSLNELKQLFIDTGYSNILIYEESIDNITGYFRLRELFRSPADIRSGIRKIPIVPESMPANKLLKLFVDNNKKLALVVDEFGGTSGIVTIEDVLEEIVGEIEDEHDNTEFIEKKLSEKEFLFSGRLEIDYVNEEYGLSLPEADDYETLAGLVFSIQGSIPKINESIEIGDYIIKSIKVSDTRLELLSLIIK